MAGASALFSHKLTDFAPWNNDSNRSFSGQLALFLEDSLSTSYHHSGTFAIDSMLLKYCRSTEFRVVLIVAGQTAGHYQSILMKNLLDMGGLHGAGRLQCFRLTPELLAEESPATMPWMSANALASGKSTTATAGESWVEDFSWSRLVAWQQAQLASTPEETARKTIVMVDDADAFELLAPSAADARRWFQQWMRAMNQEVAPAVVDSVVTFGRLRDHESSAQQAESSPAEPLKLSNLHVDRQQPLLTTFLLAHAQWIVTAAALRTGLSSVVHGTLTIQQHDLAAPRPSRVRQQLQYRALDSGVQCVASD